jgi:hypothetical protein
MINPIHSKLKWALNHVADFRYLFVLFTTPLTSIPIFLLTFFLASPNPYVWRRDSRILVPVTKLLSCHFTCSAEFPFCCLGFCCLRIVVKKFTSFPIRMKWIKYWTDSYCLHGHRSRSSHLLFFVSSILSHKTSLLPCYSRKRNCIIILYRSFDRSHDLGCICLCASMLVVKSQLIGCDNV